MDDADAPCVEWLRQLSPDDMATLRANTHVSDPPQDVVDLMNSGPCGPLFSGRWEQGPWTLYMPAGFRHLIVAADVKRYVDADDAYRAGVAQIASLGRPPTSSEMAEVDRLKAELAEAKAAHAAHWPDDY